MAFTVMPDKAHGDVLTEGVWDTVVSNMNAGVFRPIVDTVLSSPSVSVSLSALPQTFGHLCIHITARSTLAAFFDNLRIQFNGDSGPNYDSQALTAGSAMSAAEVYDANYVNMPGFPAASSPSGRFGCMEIWLPNYSATDSQKSLLVVNPRFRTDTTTDFAFQYVAAWWRSTAAITSVALTSVLGSLAVGSRVTVHAVGGAPSV